MKWFIFFLSIAFIACNTAKKSTEQTTVKGYVELTEEDSVKYELIVLDAAYETFLLTQAQPIDFYSNDYYKNWNIRYVTEWNIRHNNPLRFGDFYETQILYDSMVDYDKELNFRLYNYFLFIERRYGIVLIRRGR